MTTLVRTRGLTKRFPGVLAVDDVDLAISTGEIVALIGQNGAGKSTLIQVLAGLAAPGTYEGELTLADAPFAPGSVSEAEAAGIVVIPQEVNVVGDLTVGQNMFLGAEPTRRGLVDWAQLYARARDVLREFSIDVAPQARMGSLDLATQQLIVIARALSKQARLLILDEPTAALTENEVERLFGHLRTLRARGVACLFVSHRLAEVFTIADRIVVLRDGRIQGDHRTAETSRAEVVAQMTGETAAAAPAGPPVAPTVGIVALETENLRVHAVDEPARQVVAGVSLSLHAGEILGLFGLLGAGCGPTALALFGAWPGQVTGRVQVSGRQVAIRDPSDAIRHGVGLVSQDRRDTLMLEHSVTDNVTLASLASLVRRGFLDLAGRELLARRYVARLDIRTPTTAAAVGTLSGGNQQKVQVARWLAAEVRVLLLIDPTRGVDVGARAEIHALLRQMAADGHAVLLVSSDAEELVAACSRVVVMRAGRIVDDQPAEGLTEGRLLHAAAGVAA